MKRKEKDASALSLLRTKWTGKKMEFQGVTHQTRGRGHSKVGEGRVDATHSAVACDL